jgi:hypothetical protein
MDIKRNEQLEKIAKKLVYDIMRTYVCTTKHPYFIMGGIDESMPICRAMINAAYISLLNSIKDTRTAKKTCLIYPL